MTDDLDENTDRPGTITIHVIYDSYPPLTGVLPLIELGAALKEGSRIEAIGAEAVEKFGVRGAREAALEWIADCIARGDRSTGHQIIGFAAWLIWTYPPLQRKEFQQILWSGKYALTLALDSHTVAGRAALRLSVLPILPETPASEIQARLREFESPVEFMLNILVPH